MRQGNVFTFYFEGINAKTKPGFVNFIVKNKKSVKQDIFRYDIHNTGWNLGEDILAFSSGSNLMPLPTEPEP